VKYDINKLYELPLIGQLLLLVLFAVFVIGAGYQLTIAGLGTELHTGYQQEVDLFKEYSSTIDQQIELKHHYLKLPELKKLLSQSENELITQSGFTALLNDILKLGAANSIKFQLFEPKEKIKQGKFTVVPIMIMMSSTYDHTATFMSQVANLTKVVKVGDFTMSVDAPESQTGNTSLLPLTIETPMKTQLTLEVYESSL